MNSLKTIDGIAITLLAAISAITFLAFVWDKWRAHRSGRRVSEFKLSFLSALGGWPGGLLAMILFHHKISKGTFKFKFALALIPFGAELWAWWHWR